MYHLLNFSSSSHRLLIYLLQHETTCTDPLCLAKSIFGRLRQGQSQSQNTQNTQVSQDLFSDIKQFFLHQLQAEYRLAEWQTAGQSEVERAVHDKGHLYLLIAQLTLMKDEKGTVKENLRKVYCLLREHERVLQKTQSGVGFMARVEMSGVRQVIEQELAVTVKRESLAGHFDSKAFEYFEYQERM